jgi:hypothetical protein
VSQRFSFRRLWEGSRSRPSDEEEVMGTMVDGGLPKRESGVAALGDAPLFSLNRIP